MSFIVEDGTGLEDANSFVSVDYFYSYCESRDISTTSYSSEQIEGALVVASSDFISVNYCFKGTKLNDDQGLALPTDQVTVNSTVKKSTCQAALLHLNGNLFVNPNDITSSGAIKSTTSKVSSLEKSIEYQDGKNYTYKYPTTTIDKALSPYLGAGGYAPAVSYVL